MSRDFHIRSADDFNVEGGPAFGHGDHVNGGHPGMSLRDWFAGQALAGILANGDTPWSPDVADIEDSDIAKACFDVADAMLKAREVSP